MIKKHESPGCVRITYDIREWEEIKNIHKREGHMLSQTMRVLMEKGYPTDEIQFWIEHLEYDSIKRG